MSDFHRNHAHAGDEVAPAERVRALGHLADAGERTALRSAALTRLAMVVNRRVRMGRRRA
mgnify:CR=1 FL=1